MAGSGQDQRLVLFGCNWLTFRHGFARGTPDYITQFVKLDEIVCLTAQFIGNHRRLAADRGHDRHPDTFALKAFNQGAEIAITREENDVAT